MIGTIKNVGFKFGRWLDSVLMQRALGDGATTPKRLMVRIAANQPCAYAVTRLSDGSSTRSTRSSSWPRRMIRPVAEITL